MTKSSNQRIGAICKKKDTADPQGRGQGKIYKVKPCVCGKAKTIIIKKSVSQFNLLCPIQLKDTKKRHRQIGGFQTKNVHAENTLILFQDKQLHDRHTGIECVPGWQV